MVVNNFDLIIPYLHFTLDNSSVHFVQIIKRRKDKGNEDMRKDCRIVKTYYVDNLDYLKSHKDEMIKLAELFNARVYIHMTPCSKQQITNYCAKQFVEAVINGEYNLYKSIIDSACGSCRTKENRTFLVDIDNTEDSTDYEEVLYNIPPEGKKVILTIPTASGKHLICNPFNTQLFKKDYPNIDIHKHNPTLLYYKNE